MNFEEHSAKPLLAEHGLHIARGILVNSSKVAQQAVRELGGACVLKAQVPTGKRGKAGGIQLVNNPQEAAEHAERILGMEIAGYKVEQLLVEPQIDIAAEYYAAVLNDPRSKAPLVIFSAQGGMDIEEVAAANPAAIRQQAVDIRSGFDNAQARALLGDLLADELAERVATSLAQLYSCYSAIDAELLEVNPLVVTNSGELLALDCKYVLDDSAIKRQPDLAAKGSPELLSDLESKGNEAGIKYHRTRRRHWRARQRRWADHDHHGRHCPLRRQARQFLRDRRRSLHQSPDRLGAGFGQAWGTQLGGEFLRRLRALRRHDVGLARRLATVAARHPGILLHRWHWRHRGYRPAPGAIRYAATRRHGRRLPGGGARSSFQLA